MARVRSVIGGTVGLEGALGQERRDAPGGPSARAPPTAAAGSDDEVKLARCRVVARGAAQLGLHGLAAAVVRSSTRRAAVGQPAVAPLHQRDQHREQVRALLGQPVLVAGALARLAVGDALEQPLVDELLQPRRGDRFADPDALGEVVEARRPVEGLAQDQERRARADESSALAIGQRSAVQPLAGRARRSCVTVVDVVSWLA